MQLTPGVKVAGRVMEVTVDGTDVTVTVVVVTEALGIKNLTPMKSRTAKASRSTRMNLLSNGVLEPTMSYYLLLSII
jgi:hypothetical protein